MSAKSSAVRPMPLSWISTITRPSGRRVALTRTLVCGEENVVAFSSSSASRCTRSVTAWPWISASETPESSMRSYCSTSEEAARSTSTRGTGWSQRRPGSSPARMRRFSPLRRIRVARWSRRKRFSSWSGSASLFSRSVMRVSWPSISDWLRMERFVKIALTFPRRSACSAASRTASRWTWSKARATSPISSWESIGIGWTRVSTLPGSVRESWSTSDGRRCSAMSKAAVRRRLIARPIWRAIMPARMKAASRATTTMAPLVMASARASSETATASLTAFSRSSFSTSS